MKLYSELRKSKSVAPLTLYQEIFQSALNNDGEVKNNNDICTYKLHPIPASPSSVGTDFDFYIRGQEANEEVKKDNNLLRQQSSKGVNVPKSNGTKVATVRSNDFKKSSKTKVGKSTAGVLSKSKSSPITTTSIAQHYNKFNQHLAISNLRKKTTKEIDESKKTAKKEAKQQYTSWNDKLRKLLSKRKVWAL
jgi:hypothetical protein